MRKTVIFVCLTLSGLIVLDSLNAGQALMMFLMAGVIPGTAIIISPATMLALFALLIGFVLGRVANSLIISRITFQKHVITRQHA